MGYSFIGAEPGDVSGYFVSSAGDFDGDGLDDVIIGTRFSDGLDFENGEVYLVAAADLVAADLADGTEDGFIDLDNIAAQAGSYVFSGSATEDVLGRFVATVGDFDGDGLDDVFIGAPGVDGNGGNVAGAGYLIAAGDLATLDAADGVVDGMIDVGLLPQGETSYTFLGAEDKGALGRSTTTAGDVDDDGLPDFIMSSAYARNAAGEVHLVVNADLEAADLADGTEDRVIALATAADQPGSYVFVGANAGDLLGRSTASAGDIDGDGVDDIIMGAVLADTANQEDTGAVYVIASSDFAAADAADGTVDGEINVANVAALPNSWQINGGEAGENLGRSVTGIGDYNGDGLDDVFFGARYGNAGGQQSGEVYLISSASFAAADAADGVADGIINADNVAAQDDSYLFVGREIGDYAGRAVADAGDINGDGQVDLLIGARAADGGEFDSGEVYLVSSSELDAADAADGTLDGVIDLDNIAAQENSYRFLGAESGDRAGRSVDTAGDVDGDGLNDIIIGAYYSDIGGNNTGETYLIFAKDLPAADAADGTVDGIIDLEFVVGDLPALPLAQNDFFEIGFEGVLAGDLFANNGNGPDQAPAGGLTLETVEGFTVPGAGGAALLPSGAGLQVRSDGTFFYAAGQNTAALGTNTTDSFTYTAIDADANTSEATVTIEITRDDGSTGGADTIRGTELDDIITAEGGADTVRGNGGDDMIFGGAGGDSLSGGAGDDEISGGGGGDEFIFVLGDGTDVITDFQDDLDTLLLGGGLIDPGLTSPPEILAEYASQVGDDLVFTFAADTLTLQNLTVAELTDDFMLL